MILWASDWESIQTVGDLILQTPLVRRKQGLRKKFKHRQLLNLVTAFDIESSTIQLPSDGVHVHNSHAFMYVWQWQFGDHFTLMGRTWQEFLQVATYIKQLLEVREQKPLLIVYVHNLSYQFQFLTGVYHFQPQEVFAVKSRKILYCRMYDALEFRCSYLQCNMTLAKFAQAMQCQVGKASGEQFDYSIVRYPWTVLTEKQLDYCTRDVISLVQAITNEMIRDGDTLLTIPLTSTGYVRKDCKAAISHLRRYFIQPQLPDIKTYRLLREAFRGGNCHCNPYYKGKIVNNVVSYDMVSCYPAQQLTKLFPITGFKPMSEPVTMERITRAIGNDKAVVATYRFAGLCLKDHKCPIPYLAIAKTMSSGFRCDNGRLLYAAHCETTLTEVDLKIVLDQYTFDSITPVCAIVADKGPLPMEYRQVIKNYYQQKTKLKTQQKYSDDARYMYMKAKNKLNGIYGMSAQDPIHQRLQYIQGNYPDPFVASDYQDQDALQNLMKAHFPYQWGVYTTAYARAALQQGIDLAGHRLVYSDTDSIKVDGEIDLTTLNYKREQLARKTGAFAADEQGHMHYMGVYQQDGRYDQFVSVGAKRYCDITNGHMDITVSGVTKDKNPVTGQLLSVQELGCIQNFKEGFIFYKAGGTASLYNDSDNFDYTDQDTGRTVHISNNVVIIDSSYQINNDKNYLKLIQDINLYGVWKKERQ